MIVPGGETGDRSSEVGLIEYLHWKRKYKNSEMSGKLGFLFCVAFDVDAENLHSMGDLMADSLIKNYYCYDDLVADT